MDETKKGFMQNIGDLSFKKLGESNFQFSIKIIEKFLNTGGMGLNITLPFKIEAFNFSQKVTSNAKAACAVNTIKIQNYSINSKKR